MMKRILPIMFITMILATSCRFSEECNYTGSVEITTDWESLWGNLQKPDSLIALFYKDGQLPVKKRLYGNCTDTIYNNIPSGNTDLIVYNQPEGILSRGLDAYSNADLRLPTYFEGNILAVEECPMICSANHNLLVPIENIVEQPISPLPIVKQLTFVVNVIREGVTGELSTCDASLSGVATRYSLSRNEPIRSKATVFFSLSKDEGESDSFSHSFFVLGVNPDQANEESIPKKISISVALDDGEVKDADFDLTELFNEFNSNIFKCELSVKITALSAEVTIVEWEQGTWNQVTIQ